MKMGLVGVVRQLNLALGRPWAGAPQFFVLADSTYNPDSVDELAAAHADAQCVVSKVPGGGGGGGAGGWGGGPQQRPALTPQTPL